MLRSDIWTIHFTEHELEIARREQEWLDGHKDGAKTRNTIPDKNIIGSLAHQAVEIAFGEIGFDFESTREKRYERGDSCDIIYDQDLIDVKGSKGALDEKWYFNRNMLVFQAQLDDPKFEAISHLIFVLVDLAAMEAHIYGVISRLEFLEKCRPQLASPGGLKYDAQAVKARELTPIKNYIYRNW